MLVGDPQDPLAYLREFVAGEISYNPGKLARAYFLLAEERSGVEQNNRYTRPWPGPWAPPATRLASARSCARWRSACGRSRRG